ncbi:MAG TPA: hypothetical protein VKH34_09810 [Vicinamibacterales bacterium]|nr:hypothetical protein [Vicinamibacterales bacterium]
MTIRLAIAIATTAFSTLASIVYMAGRVEPIPVVGGFLSAGPLIAVILWLQQDARRRGVGQVQDFGMLMMVFWPVAIPWYAFASRGPGGWKLLLGIIVLIGAAPLTLAILASLL